MTPLEEYYDCKLTMTVDEAIDILKHNYGCVNCTSWGPYCESPFECDYPQCTLRMALSMAISALEKRKGDGE